MNIFFALSFLFLVLVQPIQSSSTFSSKSPLQQTIHSLPKETIMSASNSPIESKKPAFEIPKTVKLLLGAGGIYAAFLYYGTLQEDVFHYKAEDGSKFTQAWFLQALGNKKFSRLVFELFCNESFSIPS
jgi:hypothetical protein